MMVRVLTVFNSLFILLASVVCLKNCEDDCPAPVELTAQRLNIVDSSGKPFIIISSPDRQALPMMDGRPLDSMRTTRRIPGILFFNGEGDEIGAIIYNADSLNHYQFITFDQRKNDQILTVQKEEYLENGQWRRKYGMLIKERGDIPLRSFIARLKDLETMTDSVSRAKALEAFLADPGHHVAQRAFFGRTDAGDIGMFLYDRKSRPRLRMYVDSVGNPMVEKIDTLGNRHVLF